MKKFALFAMLLGSSFLFGCENKPAPKPTTTTPPAGAEEKKPGDTTPAPAGETKPGEEKPATPPADPAK
jgi:hypothetical protein